MTTDAPQEELLLVSFGQEPAREVRLDRDVLRVGGSRLCELCLPGLPPHMLTLLRREDRWFLSNRGAGGVRVGSLSLRPGTECLWQPSATVRLNGGGELRLAVRDRARAGAWPRWNWADPRFRHLVLQYAVIISCLIGVAAIQVHDALTFEPLPTIPDLCQHLQQLSASESGVPEEVVGALRQGWAAEQESAVRDALAGYQRAYRLLSEIDTPPAKAPLLDIAQRVLQNRMKLLADSGF